MQYRMDRSTGARTGRRDGFTLLELLTVMLIMFIIMGIGLGAFVGFTRGMSMRGAVSNLKSVLQLARQHAVTHQSPTFVVFTQDGTNATYVVLARFGVCAEGGPTFVTARNEFAWDTDELIGGTVYNIDDRSHATITRNTALTIEGRLTGGARNRWNPGDRIGFAIHDSEALPTGYVFDGWPASAPETVTFLPEGTTDRPTDYIIEVSELHAASPTSIVVRVHGLTGWVTEGP